MRTIFAILFGFGFAGILSANDQTKSIQSGYVFIDGDYIPPPYRVETSGGKLCVNGHSIGEVNTPRLSGDRGPRRGRGRARIEHGLEDHMVFPPIGPNSHDAMVQNLKSDAIVVSFRSSMPYVLSNPSDKAEFAGFLLSQDKANVSSVLKEMAIYRDTGRWEKFLTKLRPDDELADKLQSLVDEVDQIEIDNRNRNAAVTRLEAAGYPLTVLGMLLGVIALGINLQWSAAGIGQEQSFKFHNSALWLILGMSVLDLVWTILSVQAGEMREMNPVAATIIDSPWKLAVFKSVATFGACGILYHWRNLAKIQQAAWWATLICVLLTFRWIMMGSFMV